MKVVFILPGYSTVPIGGYKIVFDYAEQLAARHDVQVHVVYHPARVDIPSSGWVIRQAAKARQTLRATAVGAISGRRMRWRSLDPRIKTHLSVSAAARLGLDQDDVVIAGGVQTAFAAARIATNSGSSGYYFLQGVEDWLVGTEFLRRSYELPLEKIAVAPWIRDYCIRAGSSQCAVVLDAVDASRFTPGPPLAERIRVGTVLAPGNPQKGAPVAIEVLNRLADMGIPAQSFGTCRRPTGLDRRVQHYRDPQPAILQEFYHRSRVFFYASSIEGFGLPPAEAALSGAAVVSPRNGGVEAYGDGFVQFCSGTAEDITATVLSVYGNPAASERNVQQGIFKLGQYTPEMAAVRFAELILGKGLPERPSS
ncbi:MAG: glycosyl transferase, group 1 [Mycobacterium sp.]|nr:glycosyl transferase, group 1 [Mycobacterium sp.]